MCTILIWRAAVLLSPFVHRKRKHFPRDSLSIDNYRRHLVSLAHLISSCKGEGLRCTHRSRSQFFSGWLIRGYSLRPRPMTWRDARIVVAIVIRQKCTLSPRTVHTYNGCSSYRLCPSRPYLPFNGVDWFLQNAPTVNYPATMESVSIRTSSATTMSTAMTLVTNEIAVRISLDGYIFSYFIENCCIRFTFKYYTLFYYARYFLSVAKYADALCNLKC